MFVVTNALVQYFIIYHKFLFYNRSHSFVYSFELKSYVAMELECVFNSMHFTQMSISRNVHKLTRANANTPDICTHIRNAFA